MTRAEDRKRREVEIGLANNAAGAVAGTIATRQAYRAVRPPVDPKTGVRPAYAPKTKLGAKAVGALQRVHVSPKRAILAAGAGNVVLQAGNGLLDAQSAQYFARERSKLPSRKRKEAAVGSVEKFALAPVLAAGRNLLGMGAKAASSAPKASPSSLAQATRTTRRMNRANAAWAASPEGKNAIAAREAKRASEAWKPSSSQVAARRDAVNQSSARRKVYGTGVGRTEEGYRSPIERHADRREAFASLSAPRKVAAGAQNTWGSLTPTGKVLAGAGAAGAAGYGGAKTRKPKEQQLVDPYATYGKAATEVAGMQVDPRNGRGRRITEGEPVEKARRYDPEADRQRRLGAYAGLAGGAAIVTGRSAAQQYEGVRDDGKPAKKATKTTPAVPAKKGRLLGVRLKPDAAGVVNRGRAGVLTGATLALAGGGLAAYKRGISQRNQPWA